MRDQNHRRRTKVLPERFPDLRVRLRIDRGKRVVKDHNRRLPDQHLRNRRALLLPARKRHAALTDKRIVPFRELQDGIVEARESCRAAHFAKVIVSPCDADIIGKCP